MELQLKILQAVLPLISNYENIHGELLSDALILVHKLQDPKSPVVYHTASATFRQMVINTFEKVANEDIQSIF